jgi:GNAT superfamily N-acetyltransferase
MIDVRVNFKPTNDALNDLNRKAWDHEHTDQDYTTILERSLGYVCAFSGDVLVAFVNVAWDGGKHAFILDACVLPEFRLQGVASRIVRNAIELARAGGAEWIHVDYEEHLDAFYKSCGFRSTLAGLIDLRA